MTDALEPLRTEIAACRLCAPRFAATATAHAPRPVLRVAATARLLVAGQAPGTRVHASGVPFDDASGDRLRGWLGLDRAAFYDATRVAIVPMGFCFPGLGDRGADLPPPALCAATWRARVLAGLPGIALTLAIGGIAQGWHLGPGVPVTARVAAWGEAPPGVVALPHPSWRNSGWLRRNPWFEAELLPWLRPQVARVMG